MAFSAWSSRERRFEGYVSKSEFVSLNWFQRAEFVDRDVWFTERSPKARALHSANTGMPFTIRITHPLWELSIDLVDLLAVELVQLMMLCVLVPGVHRL